MMGTNLPDDVSLKDIDDNFGEPERNKIVGTVTVAVEACVPKHSSRGEWEVALMDEVSDNGYDEILAANIDDVREGDC